MGDACMYHFGDMMHGKVCLFICVAKCTIHPLHYSITSCDLPISNPPMIQVADEDFIDSVHCRTGKSDLTQSSSL